ncbi:MAG: hypothetical protein AAGJ12_08985 [Bacteroidota bacterium]|nr:hypothetical protein [uncultured Allomuricauda sp.]
MKKLKHYPSVWQAYPVSVEMFAQFEKDARTATEDIKDNEVKKSRLKLAFGW